MTTLKYLAAISLALFCSWLVTPRAHAQQNWLPFSLPANDGFIPQDRSNWFLPSHETEPAGAHGFLRVDSEGHFRFADGVPVRFVGVNLVAGAAFPDSNEAKMMAKRLAKFGVNLARLHHIDNSWSPNGRESLIQPGPDTRHFDAEQFARFDYLIDQFARHGIYICLSLNSARRFLSGDGVARADSIPANGKAVTLFEPRLLFLQKEHAANLLSHHNPYTGLRYADDPRIAMLEISNENTLYAAWTSDFLNGRRVYNSGLSVFHQNMLDSLWHDFLRNKYGSTSAVQNAWGQNLNGDPNENLLRNGDFESALGSEWILELHGNASASLSREADNPFSGEYAARVNIAASTNTITDLQLKQVGMPITQDSAYVLSFAVRANVPREIRVALVRDDVPSENLGLEQSVYSENAIMWQSYALAFTATATNLTNARLSFAFSGTPDQVYFDCVSLQRARRYGLLPDESLETQTIRRIEYRERLTYAAQRVRDTAEFYETTQRAFFAEMCRHLKENVGAKMLISTSNFYGGPADALSAATADYTDHHAYWDHPRYPRALFSGSDWLISNAPMARAPNSAGGTIATLAAQAVAGKPFSVSEYNHPFPNQYQAEALPFLLAFGSLQDWDALSCFSYHQSFGNWLAPAIADHFQIDGHPLMMALLPQFAQIFRQRLVAPAQREVLLEYTGEEVYEYDRKKTGLLGVQGNLPETIALTHRVAIGSFNAPAPREANSYGVVPPTSPYRSDTGEIEWDEQRGVLKVETPHAVVLSGFIDEQPVYSNKLHVLSAAHFGALMWTATEAQPLAEAEKSLLTVVTRAENSAQRWNATRTQLLSWGQAPPLLEPQRLLLEFHLPVDSLWLFPLDSLGRASGFRSFLPEQSGALRVHLDQRESKSVWFGLRHFNKPSSVRSNTNNPPHVFALAQNFPNPIRAAQGHAHVRFSLPKAERVSLFLYDLNGREVLRVLEGRRAAGEHVVEIATQRLRSGIYFYCLQAGARRLARKLLVER